MRDRNLLQRACNLSHPFQGQPHAYNDRFPPFTREGDASEPVDLDQVMNAYVLISVLRVIRSCDLFPDGFDCHLLR